ARDGGALGHFGEATVTDSTFEHNEARGGNGNRGAGAGFYLPGIAAGGAIFTAPDNTSGDPAHLTLENVTLRHNRAVGGDSNTGDTFLGTAWGGGLYTSGQRFAGPP